MARASQRRSPPAGLADAAVLSRSDFHVFNEPSGETFGLSTTPRLESWDARSHPAQVALQSYLDDVTALLVQPMLTSASDLAIALTVALDDALSLTRDGRDLDNYLCPVVRRLGPSLFRTAWASKTHGGSSYVTVGPAASADPGGLAGWSFAAAACSTSAQSRAWKQTIAEQIPGPQTGLDDALELQIAFRVGAGRNWVSLWKPAIDALGGILGIDDPRYPFRPRDDRIVRLGLHREADSSLGNRVQLGVWWRSTS